MGIIAAQLSLSSCQKCGAEGEAEGVGLRVKRAPQSGCGNQEGDRYVLVSFGAGEKLFDLLPS